MSLRYIKLGMVASIALFFSIVAFNNIIEEDSNFPAVRHVLSMDTTFQTPVLMQRAIINPKIHHIAYYIIISWELLVAIVCWLGCFKLLYNIKANNERFNQAKNIAFIGLFLGFLLYMVGFIIIGSEWFSMWQSSSWNAQTTAGLFVSLILFVMIFLAFPEIQED